MDYHEEQLRRLLKTCLRDVTGTAILCAAGYGDPVNIQMDDGRLLSIRGELTAKLTLREIFDWIPPRGWNVASTATPDGPPRNPTGAALWAQ
jgi:hypothetical protein